jgi:hypothetical protein
MAEPTSPPPMTIASKFRIARSLSRHPLIIRAAGGNVSAGLTTSSRRHPYRDRGPIG